LKDLSNDLARLFQTGKIKRSDLEHYITESAHASAMLTRGLAHAGELIASFKQVAVDQASSKRRPFNLAAVANDISATMMSKLRKAGVGISIQIPGNIEMDSYPGPLEQVLTNLIDNTLLHGYDSESKTTIQIWAEVLNDTEVDLHFEDDGKGIAQEHLSRVFDPFFGPNWAKAAVVLA